MNAEELRKISENYAPIKKDIEKIDKLMLEAAKKGYKWVSIDEYNDEKINVSEKVIKHLKGEGLTVKEHSQEYGNTSFMISWE